MTLASVAHKDNLFVRIYNSYIIKTNYNQSILIKEEVIVLYY